MTAEISNHPWYGKWERVNVGNLVVTNVRKLGAGHRHGSGRSEGVKQLREENARLKKPVAELGLDDEILRSEIQKRITTADRSTGASGCRSSPVTASAGSGHERGPLQVQ